MYNHAKNLLQVFSGKSCKTWTYFKFSSTEIGIAYDIDFIAWIVNAIYLSRNNKDIYSEI